MYGVTGARVVAVIEEAARQAGVSVCTFVRPLASQPATWIEQMRHAQQPRPGTIVRVNALIAGTEIPAPAQGHFRSSDKSDRPEPRSALHGTMPVVAPISRDPCWFCGVRGDIGCTCRGQA